MIIVSSDLVEFTRIQDIVEELVTTNGGIHHSDASLQTLSGMNRLLAVHPIVSMSTQADELGNLPLGNLISTEEPRAPERDDNTLLETYVKTRKEMQNMSRNLSKVLWDWIPKHCEEFRALRATQLIECGDFSLGSYFGENVITGEIGSGGSGTIFSCRKRGEPRGLALKVSNKRKLLQTKSIIRSQAEVSLLHGQNHDELNRRNILPILEVLHSSSCMFYTMEEFGMNLVEFSCSTNMNDNIRLHERNTVKVKTAIRDALEHAHSLGYAHRDVKSENILVRAASEKNGLITDVRLIDFGIACRLEDEEAIREMCGTPGFIAPETLLRRVVDVRKVDVWSLACVILEQSVDEDWFEDNWFTVNSQLTSMTDVTTRDLAPLNDAITRSLKVLSRGNAAIYRFAQQALVMNPKLRTSFADMVLERRATTSPFRVRNDVMNHRNTTDCNDDRDTSHDFPSISDCHDCQRDASPSSVHTFPANIDTKKATTQQSPRSLRNLVITPVSSPLHTSETVPLSSPLGSPLPPLSPRVSFKKKLINRTCGASPSKEELRRYKRFPLMGDSIDSPGADCIILQLMSN